jgi:AraC-like DNA-binding protein
MYPFALSNVRIIESANFCFFDKPCMHPTRKLAVHDFIYMIEGEWKVGLENEIFDMHDNDVLILPANHNHYGITPCAHNTRTMYFHVYSDPKDGTAEGNLAVKNFLNTTMSPNIKKLFEKILKTKSNPMICTSYMNTLIYELSELSIEANQVLTAQAIHDYMISSNRILTNGEIATHFNISKRSAEMIFKNHYQTTIHAFILDYKLRESRKYLVDYPDMKIISIAKTLGFYDEYHFCKLFSRKFGISPGTYRKQNLPSLPQPIERENFHEKKFPCSI